MVYARFHKQSVHMSSGGAFSKILTYPVYLGYWAGAIGAAGTIALSYFNSEHGARFRNIFGPLLSDPKALWVYDNRYEIVFAFLLLVVINYFLKLRQEKKKLAEILIEMVESNRRFDVLEEYLRGKRATPALGEHIVSELTGVADCICNIVKQHTGHECHIAIKLLDREGTVETIARSVSGATHRRGIDRDLNGFGYAQNTAFASIVDKKRTQFVSNWLRLRHWCRCYRNSHAGWGRLYRATAVVPVTTALNGKDITLDNTYGFVCADNKNGGFDKRISPLLLAGPAARCVTILLRLSQHNDPANGANDARAQTAG